MACLIVGWSGLLGGRFHPGAAGNAITRLDFPDSCSDRADQGTYPFQVRELSPFSGFVVDPLSVQEDLHDPLASRGNGHRGIGSKVPEKFIRHPRGGCQVLSRYAVGNLYLYLAFHGESSNPLAVSRIMVSIARIPNQSIRNLTEINTRALPGTALLRAAWLAY